MGNLLPFLLIPLALGGVYFFIQWKRKRDNPPPPVNPNLSLDPSLWTIGPIIQGVNYSKGMPLNPTAESPGWSFMFPSADGVHYIATGGSVAGKSQVTMTFEITGDTGAKIIPTQGDPPGRVRLYFQRKDDDWTRNDGRWWSRPLDLVPGTYTLTVPLLLDQWTNVGSTPGADPHQGFADAMANSGAVGLTFGGMFAGHGAYVTGGSAKFKLIDYKIT